METPDTATSTQWPVSKLCAAVVATEESLIVPLISTAGNCLFLSPTVLLYPLLPLGKSPQIVVVMWQDTASSAAAEHNRRR